MTVKSFAASHGIGPELSPEGHWSKNFAALSVHRRKDWVVTMKGFNRYIWDYECSSYENVYGLFASHGALLIANSETDLKVHDVKHGWDWAKVPGATTIAMGNPNIEDLNIGGNGDFYNREKLAGSLTFKGTMSLANGLFGMNFLQPDYGLASTDWRQNINFGFKKSVFFLENLLVCLGSNIVAQRTNRKVVQTTLFQDRLFNRVASSLIKVDGAQNNYLSDYIYNGASSPYRKYTTLTDAKGNFYYVPEPSNAILNVAVRNQISKTEDGGKTTSGHYGTAWFQHNTLPSSYEYAVLIPTASYHAPLADIATAQETVGSEVYKILQNDTTAHVVQFLKSPQSWSALSHPITGYVIFGDTRSLPVDGPVEAVSKEDCLIMAEENYRIHLPQY
ncbi:hypothetical protein OS493_034567 [Desmophyllum pertusum]|uniref:Polysaccharide lyase family 8 central domain-containing protein n=1 Tax=Desmophyllum pertusum TaxID=174260 RepID=A0A9W9YB15_9CNID|nr:hypothetical protein OS493_034567 [Desmophyllum pertusum]